MSDEKTLVGAVKTEQGVELKGIVMQPIIDKMNDMIQLYHEKSRPEYCAKVGMVDEIVDMTELRPYIQAFTEAVYQNPKSICPMHQMVTPRAIREWNDAHKA